VFLPVFRRFEAGWDAERYHKTTEAGSRPQKAFIFVFMAERERREALLVSSVLRGLRISEAGLKHRSFCPFLGDLRGVWVLSSVMIPLGWNQCSEGVYLRFGMWSV